MPGTTRQAGCHYKQEGTFNNLYYKIIIIFMYEENDEIVSRMIVEHVLLVTNKKPIYNKCFTDLSCLLSVSFFVVLRKFPWSMVCFLGD